MPDSGEPIGFLAFRRDEDGDISEFAVIAGRDALERWKAGSLRLPEKPETPTDLNGSVEDREDRATNSGNRVARLLDRFRKSMTSVHSMIDFTSAVAPGMTRFFIDRKLIVHARKNLPGAEDDGKLMVYNLSRSGLIEISRLLDEFDTDKQ